MEENDSKSENLENIFNHMSKISENTKKIGKKFNELSTGISDWSEKLKKWCFVDENEWIGWSSDDFFKSVSPSFQKTPFTPKKKISHSERLVHVNRF